eukprot:PhM_4_TR350/c0_g1_i1/m.71514
MVLDTFSFDTSTPHSGVRIDDDGIATKEFNGGWVTLRSTRPLSMSATATTPTGVGCRQWGVKIVDHGESPDASGLMLGLLPRLSPTTAQHMSSKYISELGGWCLSRAGEFYGSWKCERITFGTGAVVEFDVDASSGAVSITCGVDRAMGHIVGLGDNVELYPAVSLYYASQRVVFV